MTPPREWLKPPRSLLLLLFLVTLVSVSALAWFGWRLLDQERVIEAQRAQDRLEQASDRIAAVARGALAETGERLGSWLIAPPSDGKPEEGLLLIVSGNDLSSFPANRLLYWPTPDPQPEEFPDTFAEGEVLEFQQLLPARAVDWYRRLADSPNPGIRAGALLRMARVLRKTGRMGRWQLTRGQFEFYWQEASRLASEADAAPSGVVPKRPGRSGRDHRRDDRVPMQ